MSRCLLALVTLAAFAPLATLTTAGCDADAADPAPRPVVFAHGFLAAGDTWALQTQRFRANGYPAEALVIFDWNSLGETDPAVLELDAVIDKALAATGATQVDLVGHSRGGSLGYAYLADPARAAKVAHYAHVASGVQPGPAGPADAAVPTLNVWSDGDLIITEKGEIAGAVDAHHPGLDHYQVATDVSSFVSMYTFFHDGPPDRVEAKAERRAEISGRALRLGENSVPEGAIVRLYEIGETTGQRLTQEPEATWTIGVDGRWGPHTPSAGAHIELEMTGPTESDVPTHTYRTPFAATTTEVYLRALPTQGSLVGTLLGNIPRADASAVHIVFLASHAAIAGRDTLLAGSRELTTEDYASPEQTSIAFFLYDDGRDGEDGDGIGLFNVLGVFLAGIDMFFDTLGPDATTTFKLNGQTRAIPNWPSETGGFSIVVFD